MTTTTGTDELLPATIVSGMVCDALISRDGKTHYADEYAHDAAAYRLGFANVDAAIDAGFVYVTISSSVAIIVKHHLTDAQENALLDMVAVASAHTTRRCQRFQQAWNTFQREYGLA